jgi:hypothetical protein
MTAILGITLGHTALLVADTRVSGLGGVFERDGEQKIREGRLGFMTGTGESSFLNGCALGWAASSSRAAWQPRVERMRLAMRLKYTPDYPLEEIESWAATSNLMAICVEDGAVLLNVIRGPGAELREVDPMVVKYFPPASATNEHTLDIAHAMQRRVIPRGAMTVEEHTQHHLDVLTASLARIAEHCEDVSPTFTVAILRPDFRSLSKP